MTMGICEKHQYEHAGPHQRVMEVGQSLPPFPCVNWEPTEEDGVEQSYEIVKTVPEKILEGASLAILERAKAVDARIEAIIASAKSEFIECGLLVAEVEDSGLWAHLTNPASGNPYNSLPEWASVRLGYGRATYMEARRVVREFPTIPLETLREIPRCNFKHLRVLPESKREKAKWIEAAKGPEKEFVEKVIAELPELHVEKKTRLIFALYESAEKPILAAVDRMLEMLKKDEPKATKEDALEHICREWMEQLQ